ncbi:hypothetical protein [Xylophilus sp. GOD-11R]|uniref:hypothetical protein n=1 Tax=Xylophilus sp. GOD-11R TaxID=3089814 RepID=UPI00298BFC31|nr:hypothetical protein [Xylophilus sp. GOD-11R]WPB56199.1 hypothetical protein R9X41_18945 [Xylophilus sp. GOD-11R]
MYPSAPITPLPGINVSALAGLAPLPPVILLPPAGTPDAHVPPPWLADMSGRPEGPSPIWAFGPVDLHIGLSLDPANARNAPQVKAFNEGRISRDELLCTTAQILRESYGTGAEALSCLRALADTRDPRTGLPVPPDFEVYRCALVACSHVPLDQESIKIFNAMLLHGIVPTATCYASAIVACMRAGNRADAIGLFRHLVECGPLMGVYPNISTCKIAIDAYGIEHRLDDAMRVFQDMVDSGLTPDAEIYIKLFTACRRCGQPDEAWKVFRQMREDDSVKDRALSYPLYSAAFLTCGPKHGCELIECGLQDDVLDPALAYDAATGSLDLRRDAVLSQRLRNEEDPADLAPAMARAIIERTIAVHPPGQPLRLLCSARGMPLLRQIYEQMRRARGLPVSPTDVIEVADPPPAGSR